MFNNQISNDKRTQIIDRLRTIRVLRGSTITLANGHTTTTGTIMNFSEAEEVLDVVLNELNKQ